MNRLFLVSALLILGSTTQGCVIKTSSTGDPASPASNTAKAPSSGNSSPSTSPADPPAPSPAAPAPAPASPKPVATPAPAPARGKPTLAAPSAGAKQVDAPVRPGAPAPAPTARPAQPAPAPAVPPKDVAPPPKKPQPVFTAPPKPKAAPSERKADDANGVPPNMKEGAPLAYWIWRDKDGVTWHLRTTAGGKNHRFQGRIWVDGTLKELKGAQLEAESQDRLKKEDEGVLVFDFVTTIGIDGFDFKITAGRCVNFHLLIDGKEAPQEIEIGAKEIAVGTATFRLCR